MEVLFILVPISLFLAGGALTGFIWAVRKGQYDDLAAPSERLVYEDLETPIQKQGLKTK